MVRSRQPMGVLIPVIYLFGEVESKAKYSKVALEHREHKEHGEFILARASRKYNPTSSCWCRLLEDCVLYKGSPRPHYIG
jgi:hypothetical protein